MLAWPKRRGAQRGGRGAWGREEEKQPKGRGGTSSLRSSFCGEACTPSSGKDLILQTASARSCSGFLGSPIDAKAILGVGRGGE